MAISRIDHAQLGRLLNALATLGLALLAFSVASQFVDSIFIADPPVRLNGSVAYGTAVIALYVTCGRALIGIWPAGRDRLWFTVLVAVGASILAFMIAVEISGVSLSAYALLVAAFIGFIVQDSVTPASSRGPIAAVRGVFTRRSR